MADHLHTSFADYKAENHIWITLAKGLYFPDYLEDACNLYKPVQELFGQLVQSAPTSDELFRIIQAIPEQSMRIQLSRVFRKYVSPETPEAILAVGLARYDSDRGGAQEDDRIGGYRDCANEILSFAMTKNLKTKLIFLNDGPGLVLGTMWNDYAKLEQDAMPNFV